MEQHPEASRMATVATPPAYLVVIEAGPDSYGAYVPDLPGCIAAAETREEVVQLIQEALPFHLEGMRQNGDPIPPPTSTALMVTIAQDQP